MQSIPNPPLDSHDQNADAETRLKDPVCGMFVTEKSIHHVEYEGHTTYFCSASCRTKYVADPERYSTKSNSTKSNSIKSNSIDSDLQNVHPSIALQEAAVTSSATAYTCPMHPEIRQATMGSCPKCGMALEPVQPSLDEEESSELTSFRRRFWFTLPLTIVVMVLAMFGHRLQWFDMKTQSWIELVLSAPVVLWAGWPFFERGLQSVLHRSPNMWTLIGLGTSAAFVYSFVAKLAPQLFPDSFQ
jgi:P-type Cu+ transporter